jgi:capsular polysaccharide biosynthesis protein
MNNFFDNQRIFTLIWKRKFHFVIVGVIAIVLSAIFSGPNFIRPMYKSTARVYPSNIGEMSEESKTEQMLEIINSNDVKLKMMESFPLNEDYKINKDDPQYLTYMFDIYNKNISASKTQYETVELVVLDFYPQRAADMCDSLIHFYNQQVGRIYKAKNLEMIQILEKQINKKVTEYDSVVTNLNKVRSESGIIDFKEQVSEVTRGYMTALANGRGATSDSKQIKNLYDNMIESGAQAYQLQRNLDYLTGNIDSLKTLYDLNLSEYEKDITYSFVIEKPFAADKKSYPVRWIIVMFSLVSAVFMAMLVFLVLDYRKEQ